MPNLIHKNISLKEYSNIKIGGEARYFLEFRNIDELKTGLAEWEKIKSIFTTPSPSSERRGTGVACQHSPDGQGHPLVSRYRLAGDADGGRIANSKKSFRPRFFHHQ